MRKMLRFVALLLVLGLVLGLVGCDQATDDPNPEPGTGGNVDFNSQENVSIRVRNNTNLRLIAFRGLPDTENVLGGIPANATNHGLSRNGFNTSVDFALTLVTETEYNRAMSAGGNQALKSAEKFNVIYAFYNHNGTNNNVFAINAQSGGVGRLVMENPTAWNIEVRNKAYNGITLGFIGPFTAQQTLNLEPDDYFFYPVMRRFNPLIGEIIDVQPVFIDGVIKGTPFYLPLKITAVPERWNFLEIAGDATINMASGAAFVRVVNNATPAIEFFNGNVAQKTSMGSTFLNRGETLIFQVPFPRNPDQSYSLEHTADFGVGGPGAGRVGSVPPRTVKMDWLYEIQVTGSTVSNLVASELKEIQKMDIEGMFKATN